MTDKATEIANLLGPTVSSLGVELLGVEYLPSAAGAILRLYIDMPADAEPGEGGERRMVGIDECEAVSREVSAQLDVEDPISGNYTLEVSSPGVDRPLFTPSQFARFVGESAKVTLKLPLDGRRRLQGEIVRVGTDERGVENIVFRVEGNDLAVRADNIEKARLVPDWAALGLSPDKPRPHRGPGKGKSGPRGKPAAGKPSNGH